MLARTPKKYLLQPPVGLMPILKSLRPPTIVEVHVLNVGEKSSRSAILKEKMLEDEEPEDSIANLLVKIEVLRTIVVEKSNLVTDGVRMITGLRRET